MRVNIVRRIDCEILDKAINEFEKLNPSCFEKKNYMYLIMSEETKKDLAISCTHNLINWYKSSNMSETTYKGYRIATDNGLSFGEVEIR